LKVEKLSSAKPAISAFFGKGKGKKLQADLIPGVSY
jgi:hypothetical protein